MAATSLSTMWGVGRFERFAEFFPAAHHLGFQCFELNHQLDSHMLRGLDPRRYPVVSVHEPCPADISTEVLRARNWLISAPDEESRRQGVRAVESSIDLAAEMGAGLLVVHPGRVDVDRSLEAELRRLWEAGEGGSPRYAELQARLMTARAAQAGANLEAVQRSLRELSEYAGRAGVRLGLENRYYYLEIPLLDELGMLLDLLDEERVGFWYDSGHAETLARLGFGRHEAWLERYGDHIVGIHLHDIRGLRDHYAAGLGDMDWAMVATHLPASAPRTCEFRSFNTPEQVVAGVELLAANGCLTWSVPAADRP